MKASLLARTKEVREDGSIVEVVIWELPEPLPPCAHSFKYRLFYGTASEERVRYDNERGKVIIGMSLAEKRPMSSSPLIACSTTLNAISKTGVRHEGHH